MFWAIDWELMYEITYLHTMTHKGVAETPKKNIDQSCPHTFGHIVAVKPLAHISLLFRAEESISGNAHWFAGALFDV